MSTECNQSLYCYRQTSTSVCSYMDQKKENLWEAFLIDSKIFVSIMPCHLWKESQPVRSLITTNDSSDILGLHENIFEYLSSVHLGFRWTISSSSSIKKILLAFRDDKHTRFFTLTFCEKGLKDKWEAIVSGLTRTLQYYQKVALAHHRKDAR